MNENIIYLDIQCFRDNENNLIVKELAFAYKDLGNRPSHYFFTPPFSYSQLDLKARIHNNYVTRNVHNLNWKLGDKNYSLLESVVNSVHADIIYVKGDEKKKFIKNLTGMSKVFDLGNENECEPICPALAKLHKNNLLNLIKCPVSHSSMNCAFHNCQLLEQWHSRQEKGWGL